MMSTPYVSVILPVFNGEGYIADAVDSILNQTFIDFELIIINDGSTDNTIKILAAIKDKRVKIINQNNVGLALTLNKGIKLSRGKYIARQDADDLSMPSRFAKQVHYLDSNPECALLGSWSLIVPENGSKNRHHSHPCSNGELQFAGLFDSFFVHSSVMIRRDALQVSGLYPTDPERNPPEDFDLWIRIARSYKVANIPEALVVYRELSGSISREKAHLLNSRAIKISTENLSHILRLPNDEKNIVDLVSIFRNQFSSLSENPNWKELRLLTIMIGDYLKLRWPDSTNDINRSMILHQQRLNKLRLKNSKYYHIMRKFMTIKNFNYNKLCD